MTILFHFIGDTSKHQTNVISLLYYVNKEIGKISFTVAYSNKEDIYSKQKAKDLLFTRLEQDDYYTIDYRPDENVIDQLVMGLRLAQKDEWFRINPRFIKHPVWAYKLYTKDMKWHLAKNSKKVTKFIEELK
jgi:hypothetical protein